MSRCSPSTRLRGSWPSRPNSGPNGGCPFRGAGIPEFSDGEKKGVGRVDPQGPPFSRMVRREHPRLCWRPTIPGISPSRRVAPHRDRPATFIAKNYDAQAAIGDHALMIPRHPSPRAPPVGSQSARRSQSNRGACRRPAPSGPGALSSWVVLRDSDCRLQPLHGRQILAPQSRFTRQLHRVERSPRKCGLRRMRREGCRPRAARRSKNAASSPEPSSPPAQPPCAVRARLTLGPSPGLPERPRAMPSRSSRTSSGRARRSW